MSDLKFTIEYVEGPIYAEKDGREISVKIISRDRVLVSRSVPRLQAFTVLMEAMDHMIERHERETVPPSPPRHEQLPVAENRKYLNGFARAMKKIMGEEGGAA